MGLFKGSGAKGRRVPHAAGLFLKKVRLGARCGARLVLDNADGLSERGVYTQMSRIQQDSILCPHQWGGFARGVALVPFGQLTGDILELNRVTTGHQFAPPALGPDTGFGIDIEFHIRIGTYDRADIPPIQHGTARLFGEAALQIKQGCADGGLGRHH